MRALVLAILMSSTVAASADPLALSATTKGSTLELTFTNTSKAPVTFTTHVRAGLDHYDWLTVELKGKTGTRLLQFIESRTKAISVPETLAAGASLTREIDLVLWSIRAGNAGGPIEPGSYEVGVVWDMSRESSGPKQKLTAKTTLAIAPARETGCKEKPAARTAKLALHGQQVGTSTQIRLGLHNTDRETHCVHGIIRTHEQQSDWIAVTFTVPGETKPRAVKFSGDRDKSYPVAYELPPGATLWTTWDLADWARRERGAKPLPGKASLWIDVLWDASGERDEVWRGTAKTSFGMRVP